ncbi:MAG: ribosome maturation factor RimM [Helicobacter sp.]|nr:ribosome maturation factor RimM [Helicobacter sp.]
MKLVTVAKLGRSIGLNGGMKCHLITDFPYIFEKQNLLKAEFYIGSSEELRSLVCADHLELANSTPGFSGSLGALGSSKAPLKFHIRSFDMARKMVLFEEISNINQAKFLCNKLLFSTIEATKELCKLSENQFFWFELMGFSVVENGKNIGIVEDINRLGNSDFLCVKNEQKVFLIPYIDRYICSVDRDAKIIYTQYAEDLIP